jgi:hypothetical protein
MLKVTYEDGIVVPLIAIKDIPANTTFIGNIGGVSGVFLKNDYTIICLDTGNYWPNASHNFGNVKNYEEVDIEIIVRRKK